MIVGEILVTNTGSSRRREVSTSYLWFTSDEVRSLTSNLANVKDPTRNVCESQLATFSLVRKHRQVRQARKKELTSLCKDRLDALSQAGCKMNGQAVWRRTARKGGELVICLTAHLKAERQAPGRVRYICVHEPAKFVCFSKMKRKGRP